ncbi:MAG: Sec-independent protein translocase protein TatB, partial [Proteobacteria bacterium]|nr:Sec-independent protein translocase protein TatB [Pseudomonadota bacterium]
MFGIGMPEMILILAVALIVIGPKKLPDLAKSLGKAMREFKNATAEIKDSLNVDDDLNDIKKNLRKTETGTPPEKDKAGELKPET